MIVYSPLDGDAITSTIKSQPKKCFLITRLGSPRPKEVNEIRKAIVTCCKHIKYRVIDANTKVTGRDFLLKIWNMIAATPLCVGVIHEDLSGETLANIFYELGVAQALGKETVIVKSKAANIPSDFVRSEYITFDNQFERNFKNHLVGLAEQAEHYEIVADQLDRDPILAIDYLRRAFLITGENGYKKKAMIILKEAGLESRAKNSVELLAAAF